MNEYQEICLTVEHIETGKRLSTEEDGVYITISIDATGNVEIDDIGTCVDNSTTFQPDTKETPLEADKYKIVSIDYTNFK